MYTGFQRHVLSVMVSIIFFFAVFGVAQGENHLLWGVGNSGIYGHLPGGWRQMTPAELEALPLPQGANGQEVTPSLVSGFRLKEETENTGAPRVFVQLANMGQRVPEEETQKIYSWLAKNRELGEGIVPDQIRRMTVEDIEDLHGRSTIIFRSRLEMENRVFQTVTGIVFLNTGFLNIVCLAEQSYFSDYDYVFQDFLKDMVIPEDLRYLRARTVKPEDPIHMFLKWVKEYWQRIAGVGLILLVYGLVFHQKERDIPANRIKQ